MSLVPINAVFEGAGAAGVVLVKGFDFLDYRDAKLCHKPREKAKATQQDDDQPNILPGCHRPNMRLRTNSFKPPILQRRPDRGSVSRGDFHQTPDLEVTRWPAIYARTNGLGQDGGLEMGTIPSLASATSRPTPEQMAEAHGGIDDHHHYGGCWACTRGNGQA